MQAALKPFGVIYKITNAINGKIYVGKTTLTPEIRLVQHFSNVKLGRMTQRYFYRSIAKHGRGAFKIEVIDEATSDGELNAKEVWWISHLDATNPKVGYNCLAGGEGGKHGPSSRARGPKGPRSPETRAKISAANKGRKVPREQVERHRLMLTGRTQPREHVERRRESNRQAWQSPEKRSVHAKAVKARFDSRPDIHEKLKRWHAEHKEEVTRKMAQVSRDFWNSPAGQEAKQRRREQLAARQSPEYFKKAWETRRANPGKLEAANASAAAKMRKFWDSPETRKRYQETWTPEKRAEFGRRMSKQNKDFWASPRSHEVRQVLSVQMMGNFNGERRAR